MSDIYAIITANRMTGYANVPYSSDSEEETVVETTEQELTGIFETAKSNGGTLDGADATIDAAVGDPLAFHDYLVLDSNGALTFDDGYTRETADDSTSA